jgi:hypothetical protein
LPFWSNQDEAPGTVLCQWNIQRGPADNAFFHSSSLQHHMYKQVPSSLSLCWQVANMSGHTAHLAITSVWSSSSQSFKFQKSLVKFWS